MTVKTRDNAIVYDEQIIQYNEVGTEDMKRRVEDIPYRHFANV